MADWQVLDCKLTKEFIFSDFKAALEFVDKVGKLAEALNHHPDILLHSYKKARIMLFTHSENRVSEKDRELASQIDKLQ
jgi:4a-hydroxytetrahydrobiopterin dehydratase